MLMLKNIGDAIILFSNAKLILYYIVHSISSHRILQVEPSAGKYSFGFSYFQSENSSNHTTAI